MSEQCGILNVPASLVIVMEYMLQWLNNANKDAFLSIDYTYIAAWSDSE